MSLNCKEKAVKKSSEHVIKKKEKIIHPDNQVKTQ